MDSGLRYNKNYGKKPNLRITNTFVGFLCMKMLMLYVKIIALYCCYAHVHIFTDNDRTPT